MLSWYVSLSYIKERSLRGLGFGTGEETATETNSIVFKLDVRCRREGDMMVNEKGEMQLFC